MGQTDELAADSLEVDPTTGWHLLLSRPAPTSGADGLSLRVFGRETPLQGSAGLGRFDVAAGLDRAPKLEQEGGDLRSFVELLLDPDEDAAVLPEHALLARAALGVALGDQLERAQLAVLLGLRLHGVSVADGWPRAISPLAERRCGKPACGRLGAKLAQIRDCPWV